MRLGCDCCQYGCLIGATSDNALLLQLPACDQFCPYSIHRNCKWILDTFRYRQNITTRLYAWEWQLFPFVEYNQSSSSECPIDDRNQTIGNLSIHNVTVIGERQIDTLSWNTLCHSSWFLCALCRSINDSGYWFVLNISTSASNSDATVLSVRIHLVRCNDVRTKVLCRQSARSL